MNIEQDINHHEIFSNTLSNTEFINNTFTYKKDESMDYDESLDIQFNRERIEWNEIIDNMSKRIRDISNLPDLQVDVYSSRQRLLEYYHYLLSLLGKKNAEIRREKRLRLEYYQNNYDHKLDRDNKELFIMTDLENLYEIRDMIENHTKYISATIATIDTIVYGIKHRITLEEHKYRH